MCCQRLTAYLQLVYQQLTTYLRCTIYFLCASSCHSTFTQQCIVCFLQHLVPLLLRKCSMHDNIGYIIYIYMVRLHSTQLLKLLLGRRAFPCCG